MGHIVKEGHLFTTNYQNSTYSSRIAVRSGRVCLVVPVVMMREGVHRGSQGPLFYSQQELTISVSKWEGIPIVINHPEDNEGLPISANTTGVNHIGHVHNVHMDGDKLCADLWIDEQRLIAEDPQTLDRIRNTEVLEVSTGLFGQREETIGMWNGEEYIGISRNHLPDHLALLPNAIGACSVDDGCGIRANSNNVVTQKKGKFMEQKESKVNKTQHLENVVNGLTINEGDYVKLIPNVQRALDSMDTETSFHYLEALYDDHFIYRVHNQTRGTRLYTQKYSAVENQDTFEFEGDPVEVRKEISYETLEAMQKPIRIRHKKEVILNKKVIPMDKNNSICEKVTNIISNSGNGYVEADRVDLLEMEETVLDKILPISNEEEGIKDTPPKVKETPAKVVVIGDDNKTPQINSEQLISVMKEVAAKNPEVFMDNFLPEDVRNSLKAGQAMHKKVADASIKSIVANTELTEEDLTGWDLPKLERLAKSVTPETEFVSPLSVNADGVVEEVQEEMEAMLVNELALAAPQDDNQKGGN